MYRTIPFYGLTFQKSSTTNLQSTLLSYNPDLAVTTSVWAVPISLTTTQGITIVFSSSRYLDVSVLWVCFPFGIPGLQPGGLPHSEISGSKVVCTYPKLIAAYHVLHRLWEPRHPPYTLNNFLVELDVKSSTSRLIMYFLSFQYVKELFAGKPEMVMKHGFEPSTFPICTGTLCHWAISTKYF